MMLIFFNNLLVSSALMVFKKSYLDNRFLHFFKNLRIIENITDEISILKRFLEEKFKKMKALYFPALLFKIYRIKHYLHPQLINLVYPLNIFEG